MKVLIVEDDILVLKFIVKNIRWAEIGFEEPLQARNGISALEIIRDRRPDIVILDIHLPKMNGLELLKMLHEENIKPKVIILSGHDEFEYAQQAVKLGVEDYLLKPVLAGDLEKNLTGLKTTIQEESEKAREVEELKKQIREQMPVMRAFFINNLLNGIIDSDDEADRKGKYLGLELKHKYNAVIVCVIEVFSQQATSTIIEEENNIIRYSLSNAILSILEKNKQTDNQHKLNYVVHSSYEDQVVIILNGDDTDHLQKFRNHFSREIISDISNQKDYSITLGFGNIYEETHNIKYSYMEAKNAAKYKFVKGNNQIIDVKDVEPCNNIYFLLPAELEKKLVNHLKLGNYEEVKKILKEFFEFISKNSTYCSIENIKVMCYELISITIKVIPELGGQLTDIFKEASDVYSQFQGLSTLNEFLEFMNQLVLKVTEYINHKRYLKYRKAIKDIKEYIFINYHDEDLDLNRVAGIVDMNPNYLSHLYKKETGETFSIYLKKYRIEKAKELLLDENIKICDVAFNVGFKDAHYFSNCFKEVVGITPSQFREAKGI